MANKDRPMIQYKPGDLMYLIPPQTPLLKTRRMFRVSYMGPVVVHKIMDKFQYVLIDIEDKIFNGIFYFNTFK